MIIVFGSLNVDLTVPVSALPMPGETVLGPTYTKAPGGKGANQALAARLAGSAVHMVGKVGRDEFAEPATALLREAGVDLSLLETAEEQPTACALIIVDKEGRNQIAVASGANLKASAAQLPDRMLDKGTLLILQMEVSIDQNWALITRAKAKGAQTLLNVAPAGPVPLEICQQLDWLIVNEIEVLTVLRHLGGEEKEPVEAARMIQERTGVTVIVTLGALGAHAFSSEGHWHVPALSIAAKDTTAAGDCFVGAFAAAIDRGAMLPQALEWGSVAGSLACLRYGAQTSVPQRRDIEASLAKIRAISVF